MIFWIGMAALTAGVLAALLAPLFRSRETVLESESEVAIYRDQLDEIERDVERGVLPEAEAKPARTEIARRLLQASETTEKQVTDTPRRRTRAIFVAAVVLPLIGLTGYLGLGSPGTGDHPFRERLSNPGENDLFARLEAFMAQPTPEAVADLERLVDEAMGEMPENAALLQAASLVYLGSRRFEDSLAAYDQYIAIAGADADPGGGFAMMIGETIILAAGGVTPMAEEAIGRALVVDPTNPVARLYLAVAMKERGETDEAAAALLTLLADEPPGGADWADFARLELQDLGIEAPAAPDAADPAAAFTPEQMEMINTMVNGLAAELAENPDDIAGWAQLIRSYIVLGRESDAQDALAAARDVFTGNAEALAIIDEAAAPILRVEE